MTTRVKPARHGGQRILGSRALLLPGLLVCLGLLVVCLLWSITLGAADIAPSTVFAAIFAPDGSFQHLIIQTVRLPRVLSGALVGASLAVAGAIMQGLTRNPLADLGILGINSGAAFAVVLAVFLLGDLPLSAYAFFGFIGAAVAAVLVYALGSMGRGGATPLRLTLAGVILTAFVSSFTTAILIHDRETLDQIRFWTAGVAGRARHGAAGADRALHDRRVDRIAADQPPDHDDEPRRRRGERLGAEHGLGQRAWRR